MQTTTWINASHEQRRLVNWLHKERVLNPLSITIAAFQRVYFEIECVCLLLRALTGRALVWLRSDL